MKLDLDEDRAAIGGAGRLIGMCRAGFKRSLPPLRPTTRAFDVEQLFATTCGFCHSDGGRAAGKGPQLMNTPRDDDFLRNRIKNGKEGAMPAFGAAFTDAQIDRSSSTSGP